MLSSSGIRARTARRLVILAALGSAIAVVSPATALAAKPVLSTPPIVSVGGGGAIDVGDTLTTTNGAWTGAPTSYSYDWQLCDTNSSSSCFSIGAADVNNYAIQTEDAWS